MTIAKTNLSQGATGAMLGGGLGRLQGLHGLTSDAVRKVRLALWNGTIVEASDEVNQDLFWGIRGSGQNYGIILESTYETWPATNGGLYYNADLVFTKDSVERIMDIKNNLTTPALDAKLAILTFLASDAATSKVSEVFLAACHPISMFLIQSNANQSSFLSLSISCMLVQRRRVRSILDYFRLSASASQRV